MLDYGIVDEPLLHKLGEIIFSQEFQKVFIELLSEINEDIKELFSLASNDSSSEGISLYGLFMGGLMSGDTLKEIATNCLEEFAKIKHLHKNREWATNLTLQ